MMGKSNKERVKRSAKAKAPLGGFFSHVSIVTCKFFWVIDSTKSVYVFDQYLGRFKKSHLTMEQFLNCSSILTKAEFKEWLKDKKKVA